MARRWKRSLQLKMTMMLMILMTLTVFGSLTITRLSVKKYFRGRLERRMENMYVSINAIFSAQGLSEEEIREQLSGLAAKSEINIFVYTTNNVVYSTTNEQTKMWESMQAIASLLNGKSEDGRQATTDGDGDGFYYFRQNYDVQMDSSFYDLVGMLDDGSLITLRSSVSRFNESINATIVLYSYVGALAILIGCVAMFLASSSYVKPIREMAMVAKKMSQLDFDAKVSVKRRDEIGELGSSINSMSEELESTISELKTVNAELKKDIEEKTQIDEMRKEFLSHVSHELKTPIALIQGYAEGLKENVSEDPESKDFYCEVIMDEADRMNTMVKKLLALNELEFGTNRLNFERFDIVELMRNINASSDILLQQNHITLHFDYEEPVYVWGDEFMLEEVYTNYLTNAIHYAPEGGNVVISMEEDGKLLRISVFNEGNPIPEEELQKIWIKFYKVDKARTREYGGSGIGLSIVAATMKLHGQRYGAVNRENGVAFYFELELANHHGNTNGSQFA